MIGKIIVIDYHDIFNNATKRGLFLVIYDEKYDTNTIGNNNVIALKITSNVLIHCDYTLPINHSVLNRKSLLVCSKLYTFDKSNIKYIVGGVSDNYLNNVLEKVQNLVDNMYKQVEIRHNYNIGGDNEKEKI